MTDVASDSFAGRIHLAAGAAITAWGREQLMRSFAVSDGSGGLGAAVVAEVPSGGSLRGLEEVTAWTTLPAVTLSAAVVTGPEGAVDQAGGCVPRVGTLSMAPGVLCTSQSTTVGGPVSHVAGGRSSLVVGFIEVDHEHACRALLDVGVDVRLFGGQVAGRLILGQIAGSALNARVMASVRPDVIVVAPSFVEQALAAVSRSRHGRLLVVGERSEVVSRGERDHIRVVGSVDLDTPGGELRDFLARVAAGPPAPLTQVTGDEPPGGRIQHSSPRRGVRHDARTFIAGFAPGVASWHRLEGEPRAEQGADVFPIWAGDPDQIAAAATMPCAVHIGGWILDSATTDEALSRLKGVDAIVLAPSPAAAQIVRSRHGNRVIEWPVMVGDPSEHLMPEPAEDGRGLFVELDSEIQNVAAERLVVATGEVGSDALSLMKLLRSRGTDLPWVGASAELQGILGPPVERELGDDLVCLDTVRELVLLPDVARPHTDLVASVLAHIAGLRQIRVLVVSDIAGSDIGMELRSPEDLASHLTEAVDHSWDRTVVRDLLLRHRGPAQLRAARLRLGGLLARA